MARPPRALSRIAGVQVGFGGPSVFEGDAGEAGAGVHAAVEDAVALGVADLEVLDVGRLAVDAPELVVDVEGDAVSLEGEVAAVVEVGAVVAGAFLGVRVPGMVLAGPGDVA